MKIKLYIAEDHKGEHVTYVQCFDEEGYQITGLRATQRQSLEDVLREFADAEIIE